MQEARLEFPEDFPEHSQAKVIAEELRAKRFLIDAKREPYHLNYARTNYIMTVFLVFAKEACDLGHARLWPVLKVQSESLTFLERFARSTERERRHLGIDLPSMVDGSLNALVEGAWVGFKAAPQWKEFQDDLLKVAELQGSSGARAQGETPQSPSKSIGQRLDEAALLQGISHEEQAARIGISRTTYFEVKGDGGGKNSRTKVELYLSQITSTVYIKNRD
jgi:hypothetical protein